MATSESLRSSLVEDDYLASPEPSERNVPGIPMRARTSSSWLKRVYDACLRSHGTYDRLVDRNGHFKQSNGKMAIKKKIRREDWRALYSGDLFHSLVDAPSSRTAVILLSLYFFIVLIFSIVYYLLSKSFACNMGLDTYQEAFAFSLETMATIGYGTPDIFFNNCWVPIVALGAQISCKLIAEAVIIGVIYCRFGRPTKRASTVIFSDKAVLRRISGKLYFMFQLVELRKQQLVEAQVRLYTIRRDIAAPTEEKCDAQETIGETKEEEKKSNSNTTFQGGGTTGFPAGTVTHFQTCKMRLNFPNDELGGLLIMCLPQMIVHEVDAWSPLMPPPIWQSIMDGKIYKWTPSFCQQKDNDIGHDPIAGNGSTTETQGSHPPKGYDQKKYQAFCFPNVPGRSSAYAVDDEENDQGNDMRESTNEMNNENNSICPFSTRNISSTLHATNENTWQEENYMIQKYMTDRKMEIFAIVEGIDSTTGGSCQARHSYVPSEIAWNQSFVPCVFEDERDGSAVIDFSVFHDLIDVPSNATSCGHTSSYS